MGRLAWAGLLALEGCAAAELDAFPPPLQEGLASELLRALGAEASLEAHAVDLSAPQAVFAELSRPVEADAFLFRATLPQLGLAPGVVPAGLDGLFLSAPDLALRRAHGAWRPLTPEEIEGSPLRALRSGHDIGSCSAAGGCYVGEGDRCAAPCTVDPPIPPAPPIPPGPPVFTPCPPGFVERAMGGVTTCAPALTDADCPGDSFTFPGATTCVDLDLDGPWPEAAPGKRVVYVRPGASGGGATPDDPTSLARLGAESGPLVLRLLAGHHTLDDALPADSELHGERGSVLTITNAATIERATIARVELDKIDLGRTSSVTFVEVWTTPRSSLGLDPGGYAAFRRSRLGHPWSVDSRGRLAIEESRVDASVVKARGGELVLRRSRVGFDSAPDSVLALSGGVRSRMVDVLVDRDGEAATSVVNVQGEATRLHADRLQVGLQSPSWRSEGSEAAIEVSAGATAELTRLIIQVSTVADRAAHSAVSATGAQLSIADAVLGGGYGGVFLDDAMGARLDRLAITDASVAGILALGGNADLSDLDLLRIGDLRGDANGYGVWIRRGAVVTGARLRVRDAKTVGLGVGWGRSSETRGARARLEHLTVEGSAGDGVYVVAGHELTLERARLAVAGNHALWSEAPIALADVDVETAGDRAESVVRLCRTAPPSLRRLRVHAPARTGPIVDVVVSEVLSTFEDLDLRGGSVGLFLHANSGSLGLERARIAGAQAALGGRHLDPHYFVDDGNPEPCELEVEAPRRIARPGALVRATLGVADATFETVDRCFSVEQAEDLCAISLDRLHAPGVRDCARCPR